MNMSPHAPPLHGSLPPAPPVVQVRNLWTVYRTGGVETLIHKDLNLTIERGELLSIVGGSGSGKTTLLRQILGLRCRRAAASPCWVTRRRN